MKFLHTSDWHLGMSFGNQTLMEEQQYFINQLCEIIDREKVEAVVVAGDIFDSSVSKADAISLYSAAVNEICNQRKVPMMIIAGNHDGAARLASCRELLANCGLYVTGKLVSDIHPVVLQNTAFYSVPFFNVDEVKALYPEEAAAVNSAESAMDVVCNHIRENMDMRNKNVLIAHAFIVGSELSDSDRSALVGTASAISKDVFRGFDYVALGHIHRPQSISTCIRYSGSPLKYSFGNEERQEKSVTIVDTEKPSEFQTIVPLPSLRDVRTITGCFDDILAIPFCEDFLRIEVTDQYIGLEHLAILREHFPYLIEVKGKTFEVEDGEETVSVEEITTMSEAEIVTMFFREMFHTEPEEEQRRLLAESMDDLEKGGEWS